MNLIKYKFNTKNSNGQSLVEYLIIVAIVAVGAMSVIKVVGQSINFKFGQVAQSLGATKESNVEQSEIKVGDEEIKKKDLTNFMSNSRQ